MRCIGGLGGWSIPGGDGWCIDGRRFSAGRVRIRKWRRGVCIHEWRHVLAGGGVGCEACVSSRRVSAYEYRQRLLPLLDDWSRDRRQAMPAARQRVISSLGFDSILYKKVYYVKKASYSTLRRHVMEEEQARGGGARFDQTGIIIFDFNPLRVSA